MQQDILCPVPGCSGYRSDPKSPHTKALLPAINTIVPATSNHIPQNVIPQPPRLNAGHSSPKPANVLHQALVDNIVLPLNANAGSPALRDIQTVEEVSRTRNINSARGVYSTAVLCRFVITPGAPGTPLHNCEPRHCSDSSNRIEAA